MNAILIMVTHFPAGREDQIMAGETRKLGQNQGIRDTAVPELKVIDLGVPRPWRIALEIVQMHTKMIFDLEGTMVIGRAHPDSNYYPDIDLGAYNGSDLGVSREHLMLKLDNDRVVVIDNDSANGTKLNGEWLKPHQPYTVRNGDDLVLGLMKIHVELLTNPFE